MNHQKMLQRYLQYYGVIGMIIVPTIPFLFRDIFMWEPKNLPLEVMIVSLYFVLGFQMLNVSRNPESSKPFIDFIILASLIHSSIMFVFAEGINHVLFAAIPIAIMGILPLFFYPWGKENFLRN